MSAEAIRNHCLKFLGVDVGVSFIDADRPSQVVLYRPDGLSDGSVKQAFEAFEKTDPKIASDIERVLVSFETSFGKTQCGVDIRSRERRFPSATVGAAAS
jgi:hypothetical protein